MAKARWSGTAVKKGGLPSSAVKQNGEMAKARRSGTEEKRRYILSSIYTRRDGESQAVRDCGRTYTGGVSHSG